jgi:hypothetical protein
MGNYVQAPGANPDLDLIKLFDSFNQDSVDYVRDKYNACKTWTDAFNGYYTGKIALHLNDITLPLVFSTIEADVARKVNTLFGAWPIVSFHGFPAGAESIAKKNELLVNLQLKECDSLRKAVRFFTLADICGTAVAQVGWSHIQHLRQFRTYVPGTTEMIEVRDMVTEFDGPNWDIVDLPDFRPEAGKLHIKDMSRYGIRYYMDFDDILEMNSADGFQSFRPEAIKLLSETGMPSMRGRDEFLSFNRSGSFQEYLQRQTSSTFAKPVEIFEWRGLVPIEFAPDGVRNRVVTIANGRVVLRNDPDKLLLNRHRIVHYSPTPDPSHFVGIGKAQIAEPLQAAASRLVSQKLDTLDFANKPAFVGQQGLIGTQNMVVKPGKLFQLNTRGKSIQEAIMPLPVNFQGFDRAMEEIGFLDRMIQKGTGIDEAGIMGMGGPDRQTATQFQGQQEAATTRLALEALLASVDVVEPLAELFRDMNKTMLPLPKQFSLIGTKSILNPITGMPMPPEEGIITMPMELNHSWSAKAFGPMFMLTKSAQRADALQLSQIMMANPVWIQSVNWIAMARKLFALYDWDADEMLVQMPQMQQLASMMGMNPQQALGQTNADPGAAMGAAGPGGEPDSAPTKGGPNG